MWKLTTASLFACFVLGLAFVTKEQLPAIPIDAQSAPVAGTPYINNVAPTYSVHTPAVTLAATANSAVATYSQAEVDQRMTGMLIHTRWLIEQSKATTVKRGGGGGGGSTRQLRQQVTDLETAVDVLESATSSGGGSGLATTSIDTSAELAAIVADEIGTGALVFADNPLFTGVVGIGTTTPTATLSVSASAPIYGSELISNGTFSGSAAGWTLQSSCSTYSSNAVTVTYDAGCQADTDWPSLSIDIDTVAGTSYAVTFTISNTASDTAYFYLDNNSYSANENFDTGTHTAYFTADYSGTDTIHFESWDWNNDGSWRLDDVSVKSAFIVPVFKLTDFDGGDILSLGGSTNRNLIIGKSAMSPTAGSHNTVFGEAAGTFNVSGTNNILIGFNTGTENTTGFQNAFLGSSAGYSNTTGYNNIFLGYRSGYSNTTANNNVFIGSLSGDNNTTGAANVFLGNSAGTTNTTGAGNVFLGASAGLLNSTGSENVFIGDGAGFFNSTGSNNLFVGAVAGQFNTTGGDNSFIGPYAGQLNTTGYSNSFVGAYAGQFNTTGSSNSFLGDHAGRSNTTGSSNNFFGTAAGYSNTTGIDNNFFGVNAGRSNTTGNYNTFLGLGAGYSNTSGSGNSFIGLGAGYSNTTGPDNAFLGVNAGRSNTTARDSTFIGSSAGFSNTSGIENVFIGSSAGQNNTIGYQNIFLGTAAGLNNDSGNNNIIIGRGVYNISTTASNRLNIGNLLFGTGIDGTGTTLSTGNIGVGTSTPVKKLQVFGDARIGTSGSNGCLENYGGGLIGGTCSSDERLKTGIQPLGDTNASSARYLDALTALTPVTYEWNQHAAEMYSKNPSLKNIGLIAQDVEESFPELVSRNDDGYLQVDFGAFPFYIIEAIKELWSRVQGHEERLELVEDENKSLKNENELLKERLGNIEDRLDIETPTEAAPVQESNPDTEIPVPDIVLPQSNEAQAPAIEELTTTPSVEPADGAPAPAGAEPQ